MDSSHQQGLWSSWTAVFVFANQILSPFVYIYLETVCENDTSRSACCLFVGQEFARCELRFKRKMMMTSSNKQSVTDIES